MRKSGSLSNAGFFFAFTAGVGFRYGAWEYCEISIFAVTTSNSCIWTSTWAETVVNKTEKTLPPNLLAHVCMICGHIRIKPAYN